MNDLRIEWAMMVELVLTMLYDMILYCKETLSNDRFRIWGEDFHLDPHRIGRRRNGLDRTEGPSSETPVSDAQSVQGQEEEENANEIDEDSLLPLPIPPARYPFALEEASSGTSIGAIQMSRRSQRHRILIWRHLPSLVPSRCLTFYCICSDTHC